MVFISILILIVAMALFTEKNMRYNRISTLILFYTGALSLNALYIQSIGSGIGIYGGLYQIALPSYFNYLFTIFIGSLCLVSFSIILNGILFALISSGLLGLQLQIILNSLLEQRIYLIPIFSFFVFLIIIKFMGTINLDDGEVIVSTTVGNMNFQISGEAITQICQNFGSATVFAVGARIAAGLIAKHPMGLIPKIGTIGGTSAGFTIGYRIILNMFESGIGQSQGNVSITAPVKVSLGKIEHINRNYDIKDLIINGFNPERSVLGDYSAGLKFRQETLFNFYTQKYDIFISDGNVINNSKVLRALEQNNPN